MVADEMRIRVVVEMAGQVKVKAAVEGKAPVAVSKK
jgi:hypothetical protein